MTSRKLWSIYGVFIGIVTAFFLSAIWINDDFDLSGRLSATGGILLFVCFVGGLIGILLDIVIPKDRSK
jgi:hypothetical protein